MYEGYTGGIPQQLDTDVHSIVKKKTSTALWQRKRAQHCDSYELVKRNPHLPPPRTYGGIDIDWCQNRENVPTRWGHCFST